MGFFSKISYFVLWQVIPRNKIFLDFVEFIKWTFFKEKKVKIKLIDWTQFIHIQIRESTPR